MRKKEGAKAFTYAHGNQKNEALGAQRGGAQDRQSLVKA